MLIKFKFVLSDKNAIYFTHMQVVIEVNMNHRYNYSINFNSLTIYIH